MKKVLLAAGAITFILILANFRSTAEENVIYGCVDPKGIIRVVNSINDCQNLETGIHWNKIGFEGKPGPRGDTGPKGPKGDSGDIDAQKIEGTYLAAAQKSFDRSLNIFNLVIVVSGIIVALISIVVSVATAYNYFETRKANFLRKDAEKMLTRSEEILDKAEKDSGAISKMRESADAYLISVRKEITDYPIIPLRKGFEGETIKKPYKFSSALNNFELFGIEVTPDDYVKVGVSLYFKKDYHSALREFNKAIETDPSSFYAWYNKSMILFRLDRKSQAKDAIDEAVKLDPNNEFGLIGKSFIYSTMELYKEALECVEKVLELNSQNMNGKLNKAALLGVLGRYDESKEILTKILDQEPKNHAALYNRACYYSLQEKNEEALSDLQKAILYGGPFYKQEAIKDECFKNLWENDKFKECTM